MDAPLELERLQQFVERMRGQLQEHKRGWFELGRAEAVDWLEHEAAFSQVRLLGSLTTRALQSRLATAPPRPLHELLQRHQQVSDFDREAYLQGWQAAIRVYWNFLEKNL